MINQISKALEEAVFVVWIVLGEDQHDELFSRIDSDPSRLVLWRQGRSLPYGDGVTFWALSEMVKAQAGILETDDEPQAEEKLDAAVASLIADPGDAKWISGHLRPLAGVSAVAEPAG